MVTGTNGKTTTSRMIASILDAAGKQPLHNRSGSNLERGLVATLVGAATPTAGLPREMQAGLFEVDEAAMPNALPAIAPKVALFNNLFRDQLDRYGEIDTVYRKWRMALSRLGANSTLVLNADDPAIASLAQTPQLRAKVLFFGIEDARYALTELPHAADSIQCTRCGSRLDYSLILLGHLGHWRCPQCGLERPQPDVAATRVSLHGTERSEIELRTPHGKMQLTLNVPGLYNVYNGLAAVSSTLAFGVSPAHVREGLSNFTAAFGRIERVEVPGSDGKSLLMALVKNPVGFNEVLRMLFPTSTPESLELDKPKHLLIIINDLIADGRDVSWLWDVDFEVLAPSADGRPQTTDGGAAVDRVARVVVSGIRASDMAVRLKYAGVTSEQISLERDIGKALDLALRELPPAETLYVLPTYTSMLGFREMLHKRGWVGDQFWEQ
jgi:UDP-N-acetylmuramyl tripeptide synthase